jgi:hypothetical protein
MTDEEAARFIFTSARWALLSHDTSPDPIFNYGNQTALRVFGMSWEELTSCPSRLSAAAADREEREALLRQVAEQGYSDDYRGIRLGRHGRRFEIASAKVWQLRDDRGLPCGQAACFQHWTWL